MQVHPLRIELLRDTLETAVDSLYRRHASEIPEGDIEDYVSLDWFEWRGGGLRLTPTGENVCMQMKHRSRVNAAVPLDH